jgi:hypothetical protein
MQGKHALGLPAGTITAGTTDGIAGNPIQVFQNLTFATRVKNQEE